MMTERGPPMIIFRHKGNFSKTRKFLSDAQKLQVLAIFDKYGRIGVDALSASTPKDTGTTASSWEYTIRNTSTGYALTWSNTNVVDGAVIAILIQYGHGTSNGGYVEGRDYINPTMRPIFDGIVKEISEEVSKL